MSIIPANLQMLLTAIPIVKYGLLFLLVVIEGPLITMGAGLLAFMGYLNPVLAYGVILLGELVSDSLYYSLGFWGRAKTFQKYGHYFSTSWPALTRLEGVLSRRAPAALILGKLTHLAGVPVLVAAGLARINFRKFLIYDTIATIPKSLIFLVIGFYFGPAASLINRYLEYGTYITLTLFVLIVTVYGALGRSVGKKIIS